jgi:hypothetical protein
MSALEQTIHYARSRGYRITAIDNDCFLIERPADRDWFVQVVYDRFSPSGKFVHAVTADGQEFRSYAGVRKFVDRES